MTVFSFSRKLPLVLGISDMAEHKAPLCITMIFPFLVFRTCSLALLRMFPCQGWTMLKELERVLTLPVIVVFKLPCLHFIKLHTAILHLRLIRVFKTCEPNMIWGMKIALIEFCH